MKNPTDPFSLEIDALGNLTLIDAEGMRHEKAKPVRLFPLTEPFSWICIVDDAGKELACVEQMDTLSEPLRKVLLAALATRDFVPVIKSIKSVERAASGHAWTVETDRGKTTFLAESDDSIQQLGGGRIVLIDQHGTRYLIPDVSALDAKSRQHLDRYY